MNKRPKLIAEALSELMARHGFAAKESAAALQDAWCEAAGKAFAPHSRAVEVRRGTLQVVVANNMLIQELTFQKQAILKKLAPHDIADVRFRVGQVR
ncbi:MAG: DUF721 domain-containing protein [Pirellulales bacterium]